jgi:uncharacterized protein (DUF58 family)
MPEADDSEVIPRELLKALRRIEITTNRLAKQQLSGNYTSVFKGQGLAFREVRQYQPGDDIRTIDWNVTARTNEAHVKVFTEEREMTVMLVVDLSASENFGTRHATKARIATEVAAVCAFSAQTHNDRVGLILTTDEVEKLVPPKKGKKHAMRVVREILGAKPKRRGTDLGVGLETLHRAARKRSVAFVLSDFYATGYERALTLASVHHDIIPIVLVDPCDEELPNVGLATFEDFETGEDVVIDTSAASVREHYAGRMKAHSWERNRLFTRLGLDHCVVRTDQPYARPLHDLFARRARRAHR